MKSQIKIHTKPFPFSAKDFMDMLKQEYHKSFTLTESNNDEMIFDCIWEERTPRKNALRYMQELSANIAERLSSSAYEPWIISIEWIDSNPIAAHEAIRELTTSLSVLHRNEYVFIPALTMAEGYDPNLPIQLTISEHNVIFEDTGKCPRLITIDQAMNYGETAKRRMEIMSRRFDNAREQQEHGQTTHLIALVKKVS